MKVLYIYSGSRADKFQGKMGVDFPDNQFYGLNHLADFGITAEYKELKDVPWLKHIGAILPFTVRHALLALYFSSKRQYDIIFGSSLLYVLIFKKLFGLKQKFVLFDISLSRMLAVNSSNKLKYGLIRWALSSASAVVSLSQIQCRVIIKQIPSLTLRAFFVHLGIDTNYYRPVFSGRKKFFLSAGRDNGRDYRTVFEVARLMPQERFEIVCSSRNLVGAGEVPPNVTVHIDLPHPKLCVKFGEAEALLMITHDDNYGDGSDCSGQTVLLEAMANGLPIIASRKKYLTDYVQDGNEVLTVDFYQPQEIVEAIAKLRSGNIADTMARQARVTAESHLSTRQMARELATIFKQI